jgi:hypothetical protein
MPSTDRFANRAGGLDSPGCNAEPVTPDDNTDLSFVARALWVGTAGDLTVRMPGQTTPVTYVNASGWMPIRVDRVMATGTAAADIVAVD